MAETGIWAVLLVGLLFAIFGLYAIYSGVTTYMKAAASVNWPTTNGIITSSAVTNSVNCVQNTNGANSCGLIYYPNVFYTYTVNNILYTGNTIQLHDVSSVGNNLLYATSEVKKYPVGDNVTVYYEPNVPTTALLESGATIDNLYLPLFGVFFSIIGLALVISGIKGLQYIRKLRESK